MHRPNIKSEVFIAAFAPVQGEAVQALSDPARYPGSMIGAAPSEIGEGAGSGDIGNDLDRAKQAAGRSW